MDLQPQYWFPAKRYGWGWGLPLRWQGWIVLALFIALIALGIVVIKPNEHPGIFAMYVVALVAATGRGLPCQRRTTVLAVGQLSPSVKRLAYTFGSQR